jgi:hypothetical protein
MKKCILYFLVSLLIISDNFALEITTLFGKEEVNDPLLIELIQHPAFQRLKEIDQHGITSYCLNSPTFDRYTHSISVYSLLKRFNAPYKEQIAGLLHDISHTVFSHVGDHLFNKPEGERSYQDDIQEEYLREIGFDKILEKYKIDVSEILDDNPNFTCLEQKLPYMCADRIEYNLHTAIVFNDMTIEEMNEILDDLHFDGFSWFFTKPDLAYAFAKHSLNYTCSFWGSKVNNVCIAWFTEALKTAIEKKILTNEEIHFSTDRFVLEKLTQSDDPIISNLMEKCWAEDKQLDLIPHTPIKLRAIDPYVKIEGSLCFLTDIDPFFKEAYESVKNYAKTGQFLESSTGGLMIELKDSNLRALGS